MRGRFYEEHGPILPRLGLESVTARFEVQALGEELFEHPLGAIHRTCVLFWGSVAIE